MKIFFDVLFLRPKALNIATESDETDQDIHCIPHARAFYTETHRNLAQIILKIIDRSRGDSQAITFGEKLACTSVLLEQGYVGLVTGRVFCGVRVKCDLCMDTDASRIHHYSRNGEVPFFEPGLTELVGKNMKAGSAKFYHRSHARRWMKRLCHFYRRWHSHLGLMVPQIYRL